MKKRDEEFNLERIGRIQAQQNAQRKVEELSQERVARQRAQEDALRKDADLDRERVRCERIAAEAREIREQAEALGMTAQQTDNKRETRSVTEVRLLKDERDRVKQQLDRVAKQNEAADRDAAEAKAAQRELEMRAADERRAFEQQLEKQKADYNALVRES